MTQRPAAPRRRGRGFTLIETLVVLTISVGLVILMAQLYRAVGHAALSLRGGNAVWNTQALLRTQLLNGFNLAGRETLTGSSNELTFLTWVSHASGNNGKPVLAAYRFDARSRTLFYQETPLPAWWQSPLQLQQIANLSRDTNEIKLLTGVDELDFRYLPQGADPTQENTWNNYWRLATAPRFVIMKLDRGGQNLSLWLELRFTDA